MLRKLSNYFVNYLSKKNGLSEGERIITAYGFEVLFYSIISTALLLLYGLLINHLPTVCILVFVYYINQTVGGGFHADTHVKCFLTMFIGLNIGLCLCHVNHTKVHIILSIIGIVIMFTIPLVLHMNKRYLASKARQLKRKSTAILLVECVFTLLIYFYRLSAFKSIAIALFLSGISRLTGFIFLKTVSQRKNEGVSHVL